MIAIEQAPDGGNLYYDTVARRYVDAPQAYTPPTSSTPTTAYDTSPYSNYLTAAYGKLGLGIGGGDFDNGIAPTFNPNTLTDANALSTLFGLDYLGRGANLNPYASIQNRDVLRQVAQRLGLSADAADQAALKVAQDQYNKFGGSYSEGTHPALIADEIARSLFTQAGRPYQGLSDEQKIQYGNDATKYEQNFNDINAHDWQKDAIGGAFAFAGQTMQDRWETLLNDPERAATPGPISTWIQNKVFNHDNDPVTDIWGGPTKQDYQEASNQGMETGGASVLQSVIEQAASIIATAGMTSGLENAGLTAAQAAAASGAITGASGAIGNNGDVGDVLEGALKGAVLKGGSDAVEDTTGSINAGEITDVATQGYKVAKAYENDDYIGLGSSLGTYLGDWSSVGGTSNGNSNSGVANDIDLMDGPLTSNSNSALDLLPKQEDNIMSLEDGFDSADSWMLNDNGQAYTYPDGSSADDWMLANNGGGGTFQSSDYANLFGDNGGGTLNLGGLGGLLGGMFGSGNTTSNGTDYTRLLGALGAAGLGAYSANQQSNAYSDLANKYMSFGAPYREKLAGLYTPGGIDAYLKSADVTAPVQQGTDALARALSVHGNPAGQGFALQSLQDYATNTLSGKLGEERSRLGGFGGLSAFNGAAPGMSGASINAQAGVPNAIGWGLQNTLNPQTSMNDILMQMAKNQQQPGLT